MHCMSVDLNTYVCAGYSVIIQCVQSKTGQSKRYIYSAMQLTATSNIYNKTVRRSSSCSPAAVSAKLVVMQIVPFLGTHSHWKPVVWSLHRTGSGAVQSLLQVHPAAPTPAMGRYNDLMVTAPLTIGFVRHALCFCSTSK